MIALRSLKKIGIWTSFGLFPFPLGKVRMGLMVDGAHPWQLCRSCVSQPRVEACSASTLGKNTTLLSYSVRVAVSRRRYHGRNSSLCYPNYMTLPIDNKVIIFLYRRSRTFFTAKGGLFVFAAFQPATGQARMGVAGNIRELALEISHDTHRRKGRRPEKPQIFL